MRATTVKSTNSQGSLRTAESYDRQFCLADSKRGRRFVAKGTAIVRMAKSQNQQHITAVSRNGLESNASAKKTPPQINVGTCSARAGFPPACVHYLSVTGHRDQRQQHVNKTLRSEIHANVSTFKGCSANRQPRHKIFATENQSLMRQNRK